MHLRTRLLFLLSADRRPDEAPANTPQIIDLAKLLADAARCVEPPRRPRGPSEAAR